MGFLFVSCFLSFPISQNNVKLPHSAWDILDMTKKYRYSKANSVHLQDQLFYFVGYNSSLSSESKGNYLLLLSAGMWRVPGLSRVVEYVILGNIFYGNQKTFSQENYVAESLLFCFVLAYCQTDVFKTSELFLFFFALYQALFF